MVSRRAFNERRLNGHSSAQSRGSSKVPEASHDGSRHRTVRLRCTSGRSPQAPRAACEASGGSLAPSDGLHTLTGDEGRGGTRQAAPRRPRQGSGGRARRGAPPLAHQRRDRCQQSSPEDSRGHLGERASLPGQACKASGASLGFGGYKGGTRCSVEKGWLVGCCFFFGCSSSLGGKCPKIERENLALA